VSPKPTSCTAASLSLLLSLVLFALVPILCAQEATPARHTGFPQDWSQHQIVFSRDALAAHPEVMNREPRVLHQAMQRWSQEWNVLQGLEQAIAPFSGFSPASLLDPISISKKGLGPRRDWNVSLVSARLGPHVFPAKYSFDPAAPPDCVNDFVVYGLSIPGITNGQTNLVGFNNLYVNSLDGGFCPGTTPNVLFAYNISSQAVAGKIVTSPILSEDGTKIGFVESGNGTTPFSTFHVLTWTAGQGAISNAAAPTAMTSLPLSTIANTTTSAPWIDFDADTVYVGDDTGIMYKITGVFHGTPALAGSPWPITVSTGKHLSPPVLDSTLGRLVVGSQNGDLFEIAVGTGTLIGPLAIGSGGTTSGIAAPPVVDVTNGTSFVVSPNNGTSAVLAEIDTETFLPLSIGQIGMGSSGGGGIALHLYEPAFSNDYYNDPSTGVIRLCGTGLTDMSPWQYAFGFSGRTMNTSSSFSQQLIPSIDARCTGWTEFFNPNVGLPPGTDYFFFGLTQDCTGTGTAAGCLAEITNTNTTPLFVNLPGGPSGIVADNYSSDAEASSIYLAAEGVNTAYKFTQNGLQ